MLICFYLGSPGSPGKKGIKGSPGYLAVRFVNFRTQKWRHIRIPSSGGKYDFEMKDIKVDLSRSIITMDTKTSDIAQNLCLAFSISVLQVRDTPSSSLFLHPRYTGRTVRIYHARLCSFRSGVTLPELLKIFSYCCLERF